MLGIGALGQYALGQFPALPWKIAESADNATLVISSVIIPDKRVDEGVLIKSTSILWAEIVEQLGADWSLAYQLPGRSGPSHQADPAGRARNAGAAAGAVGEGGTRIPRATTSALPLISAASASSARPSASSLWALVSNSSALQCCLPAISCCLSATWSCVSATSKQSAAFLISLSAALSIRAFSEGI
jgi:hypothetical protein